MTQAIVGTGVQMLNTAPSQTASGLEAATMGNLKSLLSLAVAQATTSGTSVDFTGIPAAAKRITMMFNGVSTNGASNLLLQLGAGSVQNSGYAAMSSSVNGGTSASASYTAGFGILSGVASNSLSGALVLTNMGNNIWTCQGGVSTPANNLAVQVSGSVTLSGSLDRIRLTTINGTDTFDAGSANLLMEF